MDAYLRAVGPDALSLYADQDGYWQNLDEASWANIRREELQHPRCGSIQLMDRTANELRYSFDYHGGTLDPLPWDKDASAYVSTVCFWLPTEYLEQHGPGRVRELTLELAAPLPFCSGHAGLSLNGHVPSEAEEQVRELRRRYPGLGSGDPGNSLKIGTRVDGVHWLNFLGQPVLGELGGAAGLRARLHSPGTTVQELEGERVVVTLGPSPDAGDTEQGRTLPAYRELARVLEPWLYLTGSPWQRRFLD
jgi:hypothetical protein